VVLGWCALFAATGDSRYAEAAHRACRWLAGVQEPDGRWVKGNSDFALQSATVYNVKAAWGLCEAGVLLDERAWVEAAVRNAEVCLDNQLANGWFDHCCLNDPERPLLHTLAYAMQGLVGIGRLIGDGRFIAAADRTASELEAHLAPDGSLPGRFDRRFAGAASWRCLTGMAQTSVVWSDLYRLGLARSYRDSVIRINEYLCRHHDISNSDPALRGGVPGSWPVWGEYGRYKILNWATKFFVDALVAEAQLSTPRED
jgi:hypothetical protein